MSVITDLFTQTDQLRDAFFAYDVAQSRQFDTYMPASALADIAYILHRRGLDKRTVNTALDSLFAMFEVVDVNGPDGQRAHSNAMRDFEDAIIAESCARNGIDIILTRNVKDFRDSPVPAMAPDEFVRIYKPAGYDYGEASLAD